MCDLVEAKGKSGLPPGVLPILDDVCRTMHARSGNEGLDEKFVETGARTCAFIYIWTTDEIDWASLSLFNLI